MSDNKYLTEFRRMAGLDPLPAHPTTEAKAKAKAGGKEYVVIVSSKAQPMFILHKPGCKDIPKEIRNSSQDELSPEDLIRFTAPAGADLPLAVRDAMYGEGNDEVTLTADDILVKNCVK